VAVTFDDDLETHVAVAAPILRAHRVPATFFLTGASLHGPHAFWWERLQRALDEGLDARPALAAVGIDADPAASGAIHAIGSAVNGLSPSARDALSAALGDLVGPDPPHHGLRAAEVRRLALDGHEIGFHTRRHDPLPSLPGDDEVRAALTDQRGDLAGAAGRELRVLSYPNGLADARIARLAEEAGYVAAFTGAPDPLGPGTPRALIGRLELQHGSAARSAYYVALRLLGRR
jgi:peptidoglycan/xylan/chitin deacetylase (PgdA/CDA1 family)